MKNLVLTEPFPKQRLFMTATNRHVCYGGARGGGKSHAVRLKAVIMALKYKKIKQIIIRRTYPELISNHVTPLLDQLAGLAKYNKTDKEFTFPNGSSIKMMYCDGDKDLSRFQGLEADIVYFDEATHLTEHQLKLINAIIRGVNDYPKRAFYTCNPGGPGHAWVKRVFVDRKFKDDENPDDYIFIQATVRDNYALMTKQPEYISTLKSMPPKIREAWLNGSWDVYEGQFFEEFVDNPEQYNSRQWTHVIEPFSPPPDWPIYRSFDFGYSKPFSCGWWTVDKDGIAYRILELYGCKADEPDTGVKWAPQHIFEEINRIETEHPYLAGKDIYGIADPAIWQATSGESLAETAAKMKVYFNKGDNKRIPGWMQMHYRFQFNADGIPMMYIFSNCKDFIRTIPLLCYSETIPEDVDTTMEDHIADESRYFCMSRPITPKDRIEIFKPAFDPLDFHLDEQRMMRGY